VFHVISRFARDEWYLDVPGARTQYLALLGRAASSSDAQVLAYALMSNHTHLVLTQGQQSLSRLLKSVNTGFAIWASRASGTKHAHGPVFAQRPREVLVERAAYLEVLARYVHNNPVRAGVVTEARESDWTSHRAYVGEAPRPEWLHTEMVLSGYGKRASTQAKRFDEFVCEEATEGRRPELGGYDDADARKRMLEAFGDGHRLSDGVLGGDEFVASVRNDGGTRAQPIERARPYPTSERSRPAIRDIVDATLAAMALDPWEFEKRPRARACGVAKRIIIWLWVHEFGGMQIEVARELNLSTAAVAQHYATCMRSAAEQDELASAVLPLLTAAKRSQGAGKRAPRKARFHLDDES